MITISVCMIVKNEEAVLESCLKSLESIADEFIVVDTGSTDRTKEIALKYTDKVYDYEWIDDFAHARNFANSKAVMDYIYTADADEIIDKLNIERFIKLKRVLLSDIEIVQMKYTNQLQYGTTYNFDVEYRPKLFKRLREFVWINPIHETINIEPVIYNSDVEIIHMPQKSHAKRDFKNILNVINKGHVLSKKLYIMYAKELFIAGEDKDFFEARGFFENSLLMENRDLEELKAAQCVLIKCARLSIEHGRDNNQIEYELLLKNALKNMADGNASAEACYEIGEYFFEKKDYYEAVIWYYNAAFETSCELNIHYAGDYPLKRLAESYKELGDIQNFEYYEKLYREWELPKSPDE